ncbi:MAG: ATP-binding cassette domain-containing protein [Candidatus Methanospirare jalkutatii]|nr:ATP-binding cassette domain-containing protein [Candidatus Methanospirare jalkutatii]
MSKRWREFSIKSITLEVKKGEYFVILGPTGAGKTLLLELIAGFHFPDEGKILIDGKDMTFSPPEERNIGFIYQDYMLFPHLTVEKNIAFGLRARQRGRFKRERREKRERQEEIARKVKEVLRMLGIEHLVKRRPATLSGGEQQKVAIARALAIEPRILLLDEPLSALDMRTREQLREDLRRLNREKGITMVHVTHDQTEAAMLADRVAVMMRGRIVQIGTSREIFSRPASAEIAEFVGVENIFSGVVVRNEGGLAEIKIASAGSAGSAGSASSAGLVSSAGSETFSGSETIFAVSKYGEGTAVNVFVRPEDIILAKSIQDFGGSSSARNVIRCEIERITSVGSGLVRVRMRNGLVALVTAHAVEELGLREGDEVFAIFKATAAHTIKA